MPDRVAPRDLPSTGRGAWAEPGVEEVAPGVHRLPLPLPMDGLRAVNVYVVEGEDGLTLVDGGWAIPTSRQVFEDGLRRLGHAPSDVRRFLVTHMHRDHYTQARVLGTELGCPVVLGSGERPNLASVHADAEAGDTRQAGTHARLRSAGAEHLHEAWLELAPRRPDALDAYAAPDTWLEHDQDLDVAGRRLRAVATPGHTRGHYVFADEAASLLFAGDHVLSTITPSIGFEPAYVRQPLRDYLSSLAKVLALPDLTLLPAHGPVTASSHARVHELLEHHDVRLAQSLEAVRAGARTAWEVACALPWTRRERHIDELGPFDQALAAFETLAHLELLALRADLARVAGDTVQFALPRRG
ncbi:MBL fold metallo-hydrolase [Nocardioides aurantiacus]|uniref:Glyoxylase-like metal-dependent hydrolase (Beta-lactamase superfamily II) n=1 Tax=Nocardioides aurantiacus TaxID=86796 RepID=A0A3N2CPH3_9ACTN|nr:MBL fold metallo-hydrolase [Nocardioides aurantiacus]ROR89421.1 glyoxylase-like metal-dependent hydrolase (beta-lactamase superfamily II) [Nocardioides aurantiacus]